MFALNKANLKYFFLNIFSIHRTISYKNKRVIYLTFDDGPHPKHTPDLLKLLEKNDAKATFFISGPPAEKHPEILKSIIDYGHTLASHAFDHNGYSNFSSSKKIADMKRNNILINDAKFHSTIYFRPPRGQLSFSLFYSLWKLQMKLVLWTFDSMDWQGDEIEKYIKNILKRKVNPGEIILFHDDGDQGLKALEVLLPHWKKLGFSFDSI